MKLGDMSTVEMGKALCQIAPAIERIVEDPKFTELMRPKKEEERQTVAHILAVMAPVLLDSHLDDTLTVLSVLTGKKVTELRKQKGTQTIKDIMQCMDKDIVDFFTSSAASAATKSAQ